MKHAMKKIFILLFILFIVLLLPTTLSAEETEEEENNLVVNGDCIQGLTGWENSNKWQIIDNAFMPKALSSATMYQDISLESITVGTEMKLSADMFCYPQSPSDVGTLKLEYLNINKTQILASDSTTHASANVTEKSILMPVPEGAKYARITLQGVRHCGSNLDTKFRNIKFRAVKSKVEEILKVVLEVKEELQLSVNDNLEENLDMIWTSSDESVATVNEYGVVTALKKGDTTITVISKDGAYTDKIHILVVDDASDLRLALDMKTGTKRRATIDDLTDTKEVTWNSMDSEIATIDSKGKITAIKKGLVLITATDENGNVIGTLYVRVRD